MTSKRRIARRWTREQIDDLANKPDLAKADQLAKEIGGAVELLWNAEKEPDDQERTPAIDLGQQIPPLS